MQILRGAYFSFPGQSHPVNRGANRMCEVHDSGISLFKNSIRGGFIIGSISLFITLVMMSITSSYAQYNSELRSPSYQLHKRLNT